VTSYNHSIRSTKNIAYWFSLIGLVCLAACRMESRSDMGYANVMQQDGAPCFSMPSDMRKDHSARIEQIEVNNSRGEKFWQADMMPAPPSLATRCIRYGQTGPNVKTLTPAHPLVFGEYYTVSLIAPDTQNPKAPFAYIANFCVSKQSGKVLQMNNAQIMAKPFLCDHMSGN
jgi:hypothetical protein